MRRTTVEEVDSIAFRGIELLLIGLLVIYGLFGVGIAVMGTGIDAVTLGAAGILGIAYLLLLAYAGVAWAATPVLLYLDAKKINEADCDWEPSPALYAAGGLFLGWFMKLHHVYKRHQFVVDWVDRDQWWYLVAVGTVGLPLLCLLAVVVLTTSLPGHVALLPAGLAVVAAVVFPVGVYRDATYVRLNSGDWQPNPGSHFGWSLISIGLSPFLYPLHGAYYLYKRHGAVGTP